MPSINSIFHDLRSRRFRLLVILLFLVAVCFSQGVVTYKVRTDFNGALRALVESIESSNLKLVNAISYGSELKNDSIDQAKVLSFEDAQLVNQLLTCDPTISFELPFRIMIWEEHDHVYYSFKDPSLFTKNYMLHDCADQIGSWAKIHVRVVNEALRRSHSEQ